MAFPTVVLIGLIAYIFHQRSKAQFQAQIVTLKSEGDELLASSQLRAAYDRYLSVMAQGEGSTDPQVQRAVWDAKEQRDRLYPQLQEQLAQEEAERKKAEEDRRLLAEEKIRAEAEAKARQEELQRRREEESRFAKIDATLNGGAWIIKGGGQSDILRGLAVYILRSEVPRKDLDEVVKAIEDRTMPEEIGAYAKGLRQMPPGEIVDINDLFDSLRTWTWREYTLSNERKMRKIENDTIWPLVAKAALVAEVETNIDGKYRSEIKGGKYLVYAESTTAFSLIEWLQPLEILKNGDIVLDLYNRNAKNIINRNDN